MCCAAAQLSLCGQLLRCNVLVAGNAGAGAVRGHRGVPACSHLLVPFPCIESRKRHRAALPGLPRIRASCPANRVLNYFPLPASNHAGDNGRRYLAYNSLGAITLRQEEDHNVVEVGADALNEVEVVALNAVEVGAAD